MSVLLLRFLERAHGHLAWLAVLSLLHPAVVLREPRRRARLAASLSTAIVVLTAAFGAGIYAPYRDRIKQHIFVDAPRFGWMFERKEHLAVGAVSFALLGCVSHLSLPLVDDPLARGTLARMAHRSYALAFGLALVAAVLGVTVASFRTF